jgi:hypothetical protein
MLGWMPDAWEALEIRNSVPIGVGSSIFKLHNFAYVDKQQLHELFRNAVFRQKRYKLWLIQSVVAKCTLVFLIVFWEHLSL